MKNNIDLMKFSNEWITSWNSHDLDEILDHYSEDLEITSPMIVLAAGIETDSLKGKSLIAKYWKMALKKLPDLHFELIDAAVGTNSYIIL